MEEAKLKIIARIYTDISSKFGLPRQSGIIPELKGEIVFEKEYQNPDAFRGLEAYSRIWILWQFSENIREDGSWSPTVRPPLLGGNKRVGVFATRSSFRPNAIAISNVSLDNIEYTKDRGPVLHVSGIDMCDGTPVFDIKPYIPKWDSHPDERAGFTDELEKKHLRVDISGVKDRIDECFSAEQSEALIKVIAEDPRPSYQDDPERIYGLVFSGRNVRFIVADGIAKIIDIGGIA